MKSSGNLRFVGMIFLKIFLYALVVIIACGVFHLAVLKKGLDTLTYTLFYGGAIAFVAGAYSVFGGFQSAQDFNQQYAKTTTNKTFHDRYREDREHLNSSIGFAIYSGGAGVLVFALSLLLSK